MRIIELPAFWTIFIDFIAWFIFNMGIVILTLHLPDRLFEQDGPLYRCRGWERSGEIWQSLFHVRSWKGRLPDGSTILKKGFAKKHLQARDEAFLTAFIRESRRAELTHWLIMPFSVLFFFWNPPAVGWFMIAIVIICHSPYVIVQRYNRPRLELALKRKATR